jgi:hypothetical protein
LTVTEAPADPHARGSDGFARGPDALALPQTDWLRHDLVVSGPPEDVAALRLAAEGAGAISWHLPDLDLAEEDRVLSLVKPPDGSPGLRIAAARVLARQLRTAVEDHRQRVIAAAGRSRACPFDLHALLPVPYAQLRQGPDDPASIVWLRRHWGTIQSFRHVRRHEDPPDRRRRHSARLRYDFWSADWTPWAAFATLRKRWPALAFDLQPDYRDG